MEKFTFKTRLSSEQLEQLWELTKQDPTRRSIIARFNDGSYRVLGEVVKLPDCPQEEFDKSLEMLSELANGVEKEHPSADEQLRKVEEYINERIEELQQQPCDEAKAAGMELGFVSNYITGLRMRLTSEDKQ